MLTRLGHVTVRHRRLVLSLTVLFVVVAAVLGTRAFGVLQDDGFEDPSSESARAGAIIEEVGGSGDQVVVLAAATDGDVDSPASAAAGAGLTDRLAAVEGVGSVVSYWADGRPAGLRDDGGGAALVVVEATAAVDEDEFFAAVDDVAGDVSAEGTLDVGLGGGMAMDEAFGRVIESDLARAELIAVPITLILLVFVFGGLVAAALPLLVGFIAVLGTFLSLFLIGSITDVSIYAVNLTTALGLGLAIDYSLFIVSRYREELRAGRDVEGAVVRAMQTAGRTVALSGLTVAVSLSALLVFPMYFLRSFAYAGIAVVLAAMAGSLLSLPALLAVVGTRIDALRVFPHRARRAESDGGWYRTAQWVMRRPVAVAGTVVVVLLLLGAPFLRVHFGSPDARMLPDDEPARVVSEQLQSGFAGDAAEEFTVVLADGAADPDGTLDRLVAEVGALPGVAAATIDPAGWVAVVPSIEMVSAEGEQLVQAIRDLDVGDEVLVSGQTAELLDTRAAIADRLPLALAIIAVATAVLLFAMSGSVLVPVKALLLNLLSLTAAFGAMVWIFQDGNFSGALGFTATGVVDTSTPILLFCIAFGLSMDYEVFLLSRIKEEHDRSGDNDTAVALGLERTGRIVTAAALLMSVTFIAFGTSGVTMIKMFGLTLALAILMDAFVIRSLLVPAVMKLAGEANWWAPAPLRRLHRRIAITEGGEAALPLDEPVATPREPVGV